MSSMAETNLHIVLPEKVARVCWQELLQAHGGAGRAVAGGGTTAVGTGAAGTGAAGMAVSGAGGRF